MQGHTGETHLCQREHIKPWREADTSVQALMHKKKIIIQIILVSIVSVYLISLLSNLNIKQPNLWCGSYSSSGCDGKQSHYEIMCKGFSSAAQLILVCELKFIDFITFDLIFGG